MSGTVVQMAQSFNLIGGCPACLNNFANLWCTIRCSPDQSMFVDVFSAHENTDLNRMAVDEVRAVLACRKCDKCEMIGAFLFVGCVQENAVRFLQGGQV